MPSKTLVLQLMMLTSVVACVVPQTTIPATASNQAPSASPLSSPSAPSPTPHREEWMGLQYEEDEWTPQPEPSPLLVRKQFECSIRFLRGGFDFPPDWSVQEGRTKLGNNEFDTGAFFSSDGALMSVVYGYYDHSNPRRYLGAFYVFAPADVIGRCIEAAEALLATFDSAGLEEPVHTPSPSG